MGNTTLLRIFPVFDIMSDIYTLKSTHQNDELILSTTFKMVLRQTEMMPNAQISILIGYVYNNLIQRLTITIVKVLIF